MKYLVNRELSNLERTYRDVMDIPKKFCKLGFWCFLWIYF